MNERSFLILGSNGQLGKEYRKEMSARKMNFLAPEEKDFDLTDFDGVTKKIEKIAPDVIINCAAYNAVEDAESKPEIAELINVKTITHVAEICKRNRIFLIHYSTDYVFDGKKGDLYTEDDVPNPLNNYGKSKLAGELAVRAMLSDCLVFRPSWVFGDGMQNFIYKLRGWAAKNRILRISADEVSVPTSTKNMVNFSLMALEKGLKGLYHLTNSSYASRYEWARVVIDTLGLDNTIIPVPMSTFPSPILRPTFTAMSNKRLTEALGVKIPKWNEAVEQFLRNQGKTNA